MDEYIIINEKAIQKRIEELKLKLKKLEEIHKENRTEIWQIQRAEILIELQTRKDFLSQSTPLIPEIEKAFDESWFKAHGVMANKEVEKQNYISNLKLDI